MRPTPYLVGLAGGSGSGKTSLIRALRQRFAEGSISVVSQDDYYLPRERQKVDANGRINFDLPGGIDLEALADDLLHLRAGRAIERREYTFNNAAKEPGTVRTRPAPLVLVEGLFVLQNPRLREAFDLRVFVQADVSRQLARRLKRDAEERGYGREDVLYQWEHHVMPAYEEHLLRHRHTCHVHIDNDGPFEHALEQLRSSIAERVPALANAVVLQDL